MDVRTRTRRNLVPMVGGMTAVATATGGLAALAHVAPVGADTATATLGTAGAAGTAIGPCSAYFGFGKEEDLVLGVVDFDVVDVNGADGVAHDVDPDTNVVLILELEGDDPVECIPDEVTETEWNEAYGEDFTPDYPGPGHFAYPTLGIDPELEELGEVVSISYRVTTIPGKHTLVSPTGVHPVDPIFLDIEELFDGTLIDQQVIDYLDAEVEPAAVGAFEDALELCDEDEESVIPESEELFDALDALAALFDDDYDDEQTPDCNDINGLHASGSIMLSAFASTEYTEVIQLSVTAEPPAALPADAAPDFTG